MAKSVKSNFDVRFDRSRGVNKKLGCLQRPARRVLKGEHHLEQAASGLRSRSRWTTVTRLLEREVLMACSVDRRPADSTEQFAEAGVARKVAAHDERVDEEPDQTLPARGEFARRSASRRRYRLAPSNGAGAPETLPAASRRAFAPSCPTERSQRLQAWFLARSSTVRRRAGSAAGGRGRSLGSSSSGTPRELLRPVVELLLEDRAREPAPLPDRVIGVLDRELGKRRRLTQQA